MPRLNDNSSPALGMSHLSSQMGALGPLRPGMMSHMMGMPPHFPVPGQDHGSISGQQLSTPHSWQQQQFSPPFLGHFPSSGQEPSQSSSLAQQPIQQGVLQPHYFHQQQHLNHSGLMPPHFPMPSTNPGVMSSQQPRMHQPHITQPQLSPAMPSALSPAAAQQLLMPPVPMAQPGYSGIMQPGNAATGFMPPQSVQPRQRTPGLDPKDLPNAIQVIISLKYNKYFYDC